MKKNILDNNEKIAQIVVSTNKTTPFLDNLYALTSKNRLFYLKNANDIETKSEWKEIKLPNK